MTSYKLCQVMRTFEMDRGCSKLGLVLCAKIEEWVFTSQLELPPGFTNADPGKPRSQSVNALMKCGDIFHSPAQNIFQNEIFRCLSKVPRTGV